MARVYLAGPDVFRLDAGSHYQELVALCAAHGLQALHPFDASDQAQEMSSAAIRARCIAQIHRSDAIIANITPFRGAHMDPGTAWELGYGEARGLQVFLWTEDARPMTERISASAGENGLRDADGHLVEDFGHPENLMIAHPGVPVAHHPREAIAAAAEYLHRMERARALRLGLGSKIAIALVASFVIRFVVNRLVGW
ncbi:nucleoside 2-deoxyribosyltransferase [Xanthobacter sp. DSM 24535]|uniref:nucleoside 2-deoxyribosyltransferase n=1 Tax=Roseixanthobacter psychrophilus TaxID=3119917 RepID=UPI00372CD13A